jgi:hypothetical protein
VSARWPSTRDTLADQHAEVDDLFAQIAAATSDKRRLFAELAAHAVPASATSCSRCSTS